MVIMSQEVGPKLWSKKELLVFTGIRLGGSWEKTKLCAGDLYLPAGSLSFQAALVIKNTPANARDVRNLGSLPGSGRSPGGGLGNSLQYSCLENLIDREAWPATLVHRVAKCWMRLSMHACRSFRRKFPPALPEEQRVRGRRRDRAGLSGTVCVPPIVPPPREPRCLAHACPHPESAGSSQDCKTCRGSVLFHRLYLVTTNI